jgi:hypothetical protein
MYVAVFNTLTLNFSLTNNLYEMEENYFINARPRLAYCQLFTTRNHLSRNFESVEPLFCPFLSFSSWPHKKDEKSHCNPNLQVPAKQTFKKMTHFFIGMLCII